MKRYVLCDVIQEDQGGVMVTATSLDALVRDGTIRSYTPVMSAEAVRRGKTLCVVESHNFTKVRTDPRNRVLPDFPLDSKLNSMRQDTLAALNDAVTGAGFLAGWDNSAGFRDVIRSLGQALDANFHEDNFDAR